ARELEQSPEVAAGATTPSPSERYAVYLQRAATLGRQTAELHRALALKTGNPAFDPQPITAGDRAAIMAAAQGQAERAFAALSAAASNLEPEIKAEAAALLKRKRECLNLIKRFGRPFKAVKTRVHGDLHLGQV